MERPRVPGSVSKRSDTQWLAQLPHRGPGGSKVKETEAEAWAWLGEQDAKRRLGISGDDRRAALTLGEMAERWIDKAVLKETTRADYRYKLTRHILAHPASMVSELLPSHVDSILLETPENHTRLKVAGILKGLLQWATEEGLLESSPYLPHRARKILDVDLRHREEVEHTWTPEEFVAFIRHEGDPVYRVLWVFYACTGSRRGEALGLTAEQVDLDAGAVWMVHNITRAGNRIAVSGTPKNGKRRRAYFGPAVAAALEPLCARADPWVFAGPTGRHLHPQTVTARFNRHTDQLRLPRLAGPHGLRRTFATLGMQEGFKPATLSHALGHTLYDAEERRAVPLLGKYAKARERDLRDLARRLEELLRV